MAFPVKFLLAMLSACSALRHGGTASITYEAFQREIGIERSADTVGYEARKALFERRKKEVMEHNLRPDRSWTAAVNKFADFSDAEFEALLGHRPGLRRTGAASVSMLDLQPASEVTIATSVDWSRQINASFQEAKDQGGCGSCWAVASAGALEIIADLQGEGTEVSYEELVDCVENPRECGGKGGCKGATAELAFEYVRDHGIVKKSDYKGYQSGGDGKCHSSSSQPALVISGFEYLKMNEMKPLMLAVSNGPVVVSADASKWGSYSSGVFDGCDKDAIINHAILMLGYGEDKLSGKKFWRIRNSWGRNWGEGGYIRLLRHDAERAHCGTDTKPLEGVGCKGGNATMEVCGMCGILSDSSYPKDVHLKKV